ncbi:hypothetical protein L2E82_45489 [Cichorium intybus]|uniref:Uncharacterized protein n=1 Tax=Cichorium intybus TaxID=13427 RepID=A0ACB8ZT14_CICIN|nr:hypothetical protein L2E82_45489 [Cichorium intybus]
MKTTLSIVLQLVVLFLVEILTPERVSQNHPVNRANRETENFFENRANIETEIFFNGIVAESSITCHRRGFYTHVTFLKVTRDYPKFARSGTVDDSKRDLAAFVAHVTRETGYFCYIEEINKRDYYGRGPIQLTGNNNYGAAWRPYELGELLLANQTDFVVVGAMIPISMKLLCDFHVVALKELLALCFC